MDFDKTMSFQVEREENTKAKEILKEVYQALTEKGYNPIVLHGAKDEIWLENLNSDYKIVRIVSNYIHNNEQFDFDLFKTKKIVKKIQKTTFSLNMNALSIFINLGENVNIKETYRNIDIVNLKEFDDIKQYKTVMEVFPDIIKKSKIKEKGMELFFKLTSEINKKNEQEGIKAEEIFKCIPMRMENFYEKFDRECMNIPIFKYYDVYQLFQRISCASNEDIVLIKEKLLNRAEKYSKEIEPEMKNIKQLKQVIDDYLKGKDQSIKIVMLKEFSNSLGYILKKVEQA